MLVPLILVTFAIDACPPTYSCPPTPSPPLPLITNAPVVDDVDAVLYCKLKAHTVETESGRTLVKSSGQRVISGASNEVHVSKNRYSLPNEIPMTYEDLAKHIPFYLESGEG